MEELLAWWRSKDAFFLQEGSKVISYRELALKVESEIDKLSQRSLPAAFVLEAENTESTFVKFLALLVKRCPVVLCPSYQFNDNSYRKFLCDETQTDFIFCSTDQSLDQVEYSAQTRFHPQIQRHLADKKSLFIVRTSGTSKKKYKFILHDTQLFLNKYKRIGKHFEKTLAFSPAESIAGIETLLEVITTGTTLVAAGDRLNPSVVKNLINEQRIDYFQTTPTFLKLMLLSGSFKSQSLASLRKIAYGSEPSTKDVVVALQQELPDVEMKHTYGMSEIGIQFTYTPQFDPTLFALDQQINPGRINYGCLEVKSLTKMLCYLNYEWNNDPWFETGDCVIAANGFMKIVGRTGELLNVAGRKFFPSELEELIGRMRQVQEVIVTHEENPLIGQAIVAKIFISTDTDELSFRELFKKYCEQSIPFFMHPHKVIVSNSIPEYKRFKKSREL